MVLTNAATGNPNVKALVYIAAFAPDEGEKQIELILKNPGSQIGPDTLTVRPYPRGHDSYITPSLYHRIFAHDVSKKVVVRLRVTTALTVPLMTWVVMPRLTRLLRGWLYPRQEEGV